MEFPSVGVDIEEVRRFEQVNRRLFTAGEWEHCAGRADSLAGVWCAKEAVVKAVSRWRAIHVREVEIAFDGARPVVRIPGMQVEISISHTAQYATAVAIAAPG